MFACVYAFAQPDVWHLRGQKRLLDRLELEVSIAVSAMWDLKMEPGSSTRTASPLSHWTFTPGHTEQLFKCLLVICVSGYDIFKMYLFYFIYFLFIYSSFNSESKPQHLVNSTPRSPFPTSPLFLLYCSCFPSKKKKASLPDINRTWHNKTE